MIKAGKPEGNTQFELTPKGTHIARVYKLINLGTLKTEWQGVEKDTKKIRIYFELPNEEKKYQDKDGNEVTDIHTISSEYTLSMGDRANLRPIVEGIIGTTLTDDEAYNFDIESLIGMACLVTIKHNKSKDGTREYATVASTSELMKGMVAPAPVKETEVIDVNTITDEQMSNLHEKIQEKIKSSREWIMKTSDEFNEVKNLREEHNSRVSNDDGVIDESLIPF